VLGLPLAGLALLFVATTWIGGKLFSRLTDQWARRLALAFMLLIGLGSLAA
jgi:4-amino-4-deoxy-L-arabinose transferase-like glycosyltransferase